MRNLNSTMRYAANLDRIAYTDAGGIIPQIFWHRNTCLSFFCAFLYLLSPLPQLSPSPLISIPIPIAISLIVFIFLTIFISRLIAANEDYSKRESAANNSLFLAY
jgi:hypothetical protein